MEDWQRREFDPPGGGADRGQWQVHIGLAAGEVDAIRKFASQVVPAENFEIHTELSADGAEGDVIFAIRVIAETAEEASEEATWSLSKIRKAAGLAAAPSQVLGYISPQWRKNAAGHMGKEAAGLLRQGRDALAVIRAQTACELLVAETFEKLLASKYPDVRSENLIRRPANLTDKTSLALMQLLTGRRIQDETWWSGYAEHRKRRNAIIHEGVAIAHEDAQASIATMNDLHEWLLEVREAAFEAEQAKAEGNDGG
jgi:hypothetical protein